MSQMASHFPDNTKTLLSKYNFNVIFDDTNQDITCILCKNLVTDAYQTYCGCLYCRTCIVEFLSNGDIYCCGNKDECRDEYLILENNVFKSAVMDRKVLKARVVCPNETCEYKTELSEMEEHLRLCSKQTIKCPYLSIGCDNSKVTRETILPHIHSETLPHTELLIDFIHNLRNEIETNKSQIFSLKEDSIRKKMEMDELKEENARLLERCEHNESRIESLTELFRIQDGRISMLEADTEVIEAQIPTAEAGNSEHYEPTCHMALDGPPLLREDSFHAESGETTCTFTVHRFSATKTAQDDVYSPYFYSYANGYKMRLRVYPGGFGSALGSHLSVYLVLSKGEYDADVPWPCKCRFTVAIVSQSTGLAAHSESFSYDTVSDNYKHSFVRPINRENTGYGYHAFISHAELRSTAGLLVNDDIVLRCTVTR